MGCGCNKKAAGTASAPAGRTTVYEVLDSNQAVVETFSSLQDARNKAIAITGRVRVTSKSI